MTMRRSTILATLALATGSTEAGADHFAVFVLTGQSNALGTTALESPHDPGTHAADASTGFFWANAAGGTGSNIVYPPALFGDSGGVITTLQVQQGDGGANPQFWGPEFGFARTMHDAGRSNVLIIKTAKGGGRNLYWDKATFDSDPDSGHMWGHTRDTIDAALAQLVSGGHTFEVEGFMYLQGESNTTSDAVVAGARLGDLIDNLRVHIGGAYPGTADEMRTVIGEIAASGSTSARITTTNQQQALAAADDTVAFIGTSDLPLKSDGIHFGRDAKLTIGQRFADAFIGRPEVVATTFADIAGGPGATNLIFDRYVPDTNGAPNGPGLDNPGTYFGFVNGDNGQAAAGMTVAGSAGKVVFADYSGASTTSDIAGGDYSLLSVKAGNVTAGVIKYYQLWYRNPSGSPCAFDFNTTNGLQLIWGP